MRRKTIARLYIVVVGLFTAAAAFQGFHNYTTALALFLTAVSLFCITTVFAVAYILSKVVSKATKVSPKPPLQQEPADSTESATNSELTLARLAKRLEPRRIEPFLKEKAVRVLEARPKGSVEIVHLATDHEAWILAIDFLHIMNGAGWNVLDSPRGLATILDLGAAPFGITVQARVIDADLGDASLYEALEDAVATAGFRFSVGISADLPINRCRIIIGPKQ